MNITQHKYITCISKPAESAESEKTLNISAKTIVMSLYMEFQEVK